MKVTIFTPTYNRAYIMQNLYDSLCRQTCKDFEWVIVNDGSTDTTDDLVAKFTEDHVLNIKYHKQLNGGKASAINSGIKIATGELFFIVDSDDYITDDAVQQITEEWANVAYKTKIAGLCFRKINLASNEIIGKLFPAHNPMATSLEIMYKWSIRGDKAEVFVTDILRQFPFPTYKGEKFVTEALVWNKIARSNRPYLICINRGIYYCEYLPDGLTSNYNTLLRQNPKGYIRYYSSLLFDTVVWCNPINVARVCVRLLQTVFYRII